MVRRRTAVSIAAAGLLLASPALTACGSGPAHAGAAATVGQHRITMSTLQANVNTLRAAQTKALQQGAQPGQNASADLSTQTLSALVQQEVISRAVSDAHVTVSAGEVQQDKAQALQQFGGSESQLDAVLLQNYDVLPSGADAFFRTNVQLSKLIVRLGYQPGSDGGQTAVVAALSKTAKTLGVRINPRYGKWDEKNAVVGTATDPWVVNKTPTAPDDTATPGAGIA
jgi:SurA N-terminal domain